MRRAAAAGLAGFAFCLLLVAILSHASRRGQDGPITNPTDFRTFYCAGRALDGGGDPYRVEPMRRCDRETLAENGFRSDGRFVFPAPFPPYAIAFFGAFARLPFGLATTVWFALDLFSVGLVIVLVAALSGVRPALVALATFGPVGMASLLYGQLVPIVLAGAVLAALGLRRHNPWLVAAGAATASLEPHLALPLWLGAIVACRFARVPLAAAGLSIVALSLLAGVALNGEFLAAVLPAHARSELYDFSSQYSLSSALAALGVPASAALAAGSASYGLMLAAGCALGVALARRYRDPAFAALAPPAVVLLGGPFLHAHQIGAALPFALLLLPRLRRGSPAFVTLALGVVLLAIPWQTISQMPFLADRGAATAPVQPVRLPTPARDAPIEPQYTAFIDAFAERLDRRSLAEQFAWKIPTWLGLGALLGAGLAAVRSRAQSPAAPAGAAAVFTGPAGGRNASSSALTSPANSSS